MESSRILLAVFGQKKRSLRCPIPAAIHSPSNFRCACHEHVEPLRRHPLLEGWALLPTPPIRCLHKEVHPHGLGWMRQFINSRFLQSGWSANKQVRSYGDNKSCEKHFVLRANWLRFQLQSIRFARTSIAAKASASSSRACPSTSPTVPSSRISLKTPGRDSRWE